MLAKTEHIRCKIHGMIKVRNVQRNIHKIHIYIHRNRLDKHTHTHTQCIYVCICVFNLMSGWVGGRNISLDHGNQPELNNLMGNIIKLLSNSSM